MNTFDDGYIRLAHAIVYQAIEDWHKYKKLRPEIGRFFNSGWCDSLLIGTSTDGKTIRNRIKKTKAPDRSEW